VRLRRRRARLQPYYRPEPDLASLPGDWWERKHPMPGVEMDLDEQLRLAEGPLAPYISEFAPPRLPTGRSGEYHTDNGSFESVDGEVAYAFVRHLRPGRIIELGSGSSTLALAAAAAANARDGVPTRLETFDPYPGDRVPDGLAGLSVLQTRPAQDISPAEFESLGEGDLLFVDTSHVVRTGGEVNFVVLEVLPLLQRGVVVHFHDVFLPYEYHRAWLETGRFFTEQYLLQAFLSMNPEYEVLFAAHALLRERRARLARLVPSLESHQPSSFWIRRAPA